MPIPDPTEHEDQSEFHARCMRAIYDEYGQEQGNAICFSQWRRHNGEKSIDTGAGLVAYDLQGQKKKAASMDTPLRLFGQIQKVEEQNDGTIKVYGTASSEAVDQEGETVKADAMRAAIPDYMRFPALRSMHQLDAAGTTLEASVGSDNSTKIIAHVVDPVAVLKVKNRVFRGFSIGGRVLEREAGNYKTISKLQLNEISLVDRPCNPEAILDCWKADYVNGDTQMPDGLGTMEAAFHKAMAEVGPQIWPCGVPEHQHSRKEDAAKCRMAKSVTMPPMKDLHTGAEKHLGAEKHGLPDGPSIRPNGGGTEKHGLPGQGVTQPSGEPPGGPNSEENFDGDHDSDDDTTSAESAGGGYQPESASERREDFGKKANGDAKEPYGKVPYADPGYQSDGKKRYPIDTEAHVRAAWSYINQADNARAYSSENLGRVKAKIRAAARRHGIEISEKAIFDLGDPDALIKSLASSSLDMQLEELPYDLDLVIEKAGRRQSAADQFMKQWAHDAISKVTDMAFCMKAEANATQDTGGKAEHSAPDQGTDSGTAHYRTGENATQDTNKRGARHNATTMGFLRKAHDNLCRAGAACPAHDNDGTSKAATTEDGAMSATTDDEGAAVAQALKKALKKNDKLEDKIAALTTQVSNLTVHMEYLAKGKEGPPPQPVAVPEKTKKFEKALAARDAELAEMKELLQQIAKQPVPGSASHLPTGFFNVSKAQDGGAPLTPEQRQEVEEFLKTLTPDQRQEWQFRRDLRHSHMRPYAQQR